MTVVFCGHRNINGKEKELTEKLAEALTAIFEKGKKFNYLIKFYCGGYGKFDLLVSHVIDKVRKLFPSVNCEKVLVVPYLNISLEKREALMLEYDHLLYPSIENVPYRFAIAKRNEWMVEQADIIVSYTEHNWGGAFQMVKFAEKKHKNILYLSIRHPDAM